jgi:hypothetical protein
VIRRSSTEATVSFGLSPTMQPAKVVTAVARAARSLRFISVLMDGVAKG